MINTGRKDRHDKHRAERIDMINTGRKDGHDKHRACVSSMQCHAALVHPV